MKNNIDYESLVQLALRGVIKDILKLTAKTGLIGDHHFLITFVTTHPDVVCPSYLMEENPEEMTIILQHEFYNLVAEDLYFRITLNFNDKLENLIVPYAAIVCFVDPSVKFGLHFDDVEDILDPAAISEVFQGEDTPNVISLDEFRKKHTKKKT